jgi:dephospho-CoA kinase
MKNKRLILGVTGHPSCGKDTVAEYLVAKHGFSFVSTSDEIRRYMKDNSLGEPTRERMNPIAQKMRRYFGPDVLIRFALEKNAGAGRIVMVGIRATAEADSVKKAGGSMIAVTAPIEVRFKRAQERGRIGDDTSFQAFKAIEEKESVGTNAAEQNVNAVIAQADYIINNTGTLEELYRAVDDIVAKAASK